MTTKTAAKSKKSTAVAAKKKAGEVAMKDFLKQMRKDAGAGQEGIGREDVALPFIKLLQQMSPETNKRDASYVEGAEAGHFYNTVTEEVFNGEKGVVIIPVFYEKTHIEWVPRSAGGGFVAEHLTREDAIANAEPENEINDTANHYLLIQTNNGQWQQALFPMTSTKLRASRQLNALIRLKSMKDEDGEIFTPPSFGFQYLITSAEEENDQGRFFIPKVADLGPIDSMELYGEGRKFYRLCKEGSVRVDFNRYENQGDGADVAKDEKLPTF